MLLSSSNHAILGPDFYRQQAPQVARALLGMRLVHEQHGQRLAGIITECEAYLGESDLACHARAGRTARTAVMYGPPGRAYVYRIYGMYWMLNCVTGAVDDPQAVLIRAIHPTEGLDQMAQRRAPLPPAQWTNGPGRLCIALGIDASLKGVDLTTPHAGLWIEACEALPDAAVSSTPRIGLENVPEPWRSQPWRYVVDLKHPSTYVSEEST